MDDLDLRLRRRRGYDQLVPEQVRQGLLLVGSMLLATTIAVGVLLELT